MKIFSFRYLKSIFIFVLLSVVNHVDEKMHDRLDMSMLRSSHIVLVHHKRGITSSFFKQRKNLLTLKFQEKDVKGFLFFL